MRFHKLRDGILNKIGIKIRLRIVCLWYLISLMIETRKHSLTSASELSGLGISSFSKFLQNNKDVIMHTLKDLSKKQAKIYSEVIGKAADIPWHIFILIDSTIQGRSSLKSWGWHEYAARFYKYVAPMGLT